MLFLPYITNSFAMKFYQVCWSNKMASGYGTSVYILGWRQQKIQTIFITPWLCRFVLGFWGRQQNTTRKSQHTLLPQYHHRRPQKSLLKKACLVIKKVGRNVVFFICACERKQSRNRVDLNSQVDWFFDCRSNGLWQMVTIELWQKCLTLSTHQFCQGVSKHGF